MIRESALIYPSAMSKPRASGDDPHALALIIIDIL